MSESPQLADPSPGVRQITLNRPAKKNAFDDAQWDGFADALACRLEAGGKILDAGADGLVGHADRAFELLAHFAAALTDLAGDIGCGCCEALAEFVAAQDPTDPGVLILSNLAGAARELGSALLVNPYDSRAVGHAIQAALSMTLPERRDRHAAMMQVLKRNDIAAWTRRFVETLEQTQSSDARVRAIGSSN